MWALSAHRHQLLPKSTGTRRPRPSRGAPPATSQPFPALPTLQEGSHWDRGLPQEPDSVLFALAKSVSVTCPSGKSRHPHCTAHRLGGPGPPWEQGAPRRSAPSSSASSRSCHGAPVCAAPCPACRGACPTAPRGCRRSSQTAGGAAQGREEPGGGAHGGHRATPSGAAPASCSGPEPARVSPGPRRLGLPWAAPSRASGWPAARPPRLSLGARATCRAGRGGTSGAATQALPGPPRPPAPGGRLGVLPPRALLQHRGWHNQQSRATGHVPRARAQPQD